MKLLMENWRKHLDEMVDETPTWGVLVKTDQMISKMVGYHASSAVFDQFDNSRLGSNTDMGKAGEGKYNLDSYLGHMFVPDAQQLTPHMKKLRSRYIYSVTLTPGRVAVIDIRQFKKWFGKDEPNAKARLRQFGKWLKSKGYGGLRYTDSQSDTTLLSDTIQVFDAGNTNIRSIWDTETNKRFRAKDLQGQSFADAFGVKE
tara:strand:+ start:1003 stop:1605 length:603 start_codon:yes stop_codon:yes gene_type:complete